MPRSSDTVKSLKAASATAGAFDHGIRFAGNSPFQPFTAMAKSMVRNGLDYLDVLGAIVDLVAIQMMDDFSLLEEAAKNPRGYQTMFVHIPAHVGIWMRGHLHEDVAARGQGPSAFPERIALAPLQSERA